MTVNALLGLAWRLDRLTSIGDLERRAVFRPRVVVIALSRVPVALFLIGRNNAPFSSVPCRAASR
jgi:hypothetical protein